MSQPSPSQYVSTNSKQVLNGCAQCASQYIIDDQGQTCLNATTLSLDPSVCQVAYPNGTCKTCQTASQVFYDSSNSSTFSCSSQTPISNCVRQYLVAGIAKCSACKGGFVLQNDQTVCLPIDPIYSVYANQIVLYGCAKLDASNALCDYTTGCAPGFVSNGVNCTCQTLPLLPYSQYYCTTSTSSISNCALVSSEGTVTACLSCTSGYL